MPQVRHQLRSRTGERSVRDQARERTRSVHRARERPRNDDRRRASDVRRSTGAAAIASRPTYFCIEASRWSSISCVRSATKLPSSSARARRSARHALTAESCSTCSRESTTRGLETRHALVLWRMICSSRDPSDFELLPGPYVVTNQSSVERCWSPLRALERSSRRDLELCSSSSAAARRPRRCDAESTGRRASPGSRGKRRMGRDVGVRGRRSTHSGKGRGPLGSVCRRDVPRARGAR